MALRESLEREYTQLANPYHDTPSYTSNYGPENVPNPQTNFQSMTAPTGGFEQMPAVTPQYGQPQYGQQSIAPGEPAPGSYSPGPVQTTPQTPQPSQQQTEIGRQADTNYSGGLFPGFDYGKMQDPAHASTSAKYAFAQLAQASGRMPQSKAEAEQWFTQYIKPGLDARGFKVDWVRGDKAFIRTRENPQGEVVDFIQGAGAGGQAFQWGTGGGSSGDASGPTVMPGPMSYQPTGPMITPFGGVPPSVGGYQAQPGTPGVPGYNPGTLPTGSLPTYNPSTFSQFQAPNLSGIESEQENVLMDVLRRPALSSEYVQRQQQAQREGAHAAYGQQADEMSRRAAARGVLGGGNLANRILNLGDVRTRAILESDRDIANRAEEANFAGRLQAIGAAEGVLGGRGGRAVDFYNTLLGGQRTQADENFRGYGSQADRVRFDLERALAQEGINADAYRTNLGESQFGRNLGQRESEFGRDLAYRYGIANLGSYENFVNNILRGRR